MRLIENHILGSSSIFFGTSHHIYSYAVTVASPYSRYL